jgi:hypothetical protein
MLAGSEAARSLPQIPFINNFLCKLFGGVEYLLYICAVFVKACNRQA